MSLKEPRRSTHKIWDPAYLTHASTQSMHAWRRSNINSLSQFLANQGVHNLFLTSHFMVMNDMELQSEPLYCILLESLSVGTLWGNSDMLLDMSMANQQETRIEYLQAAAGFRGAVYLVGVELSQEEAFEWWDTLRHSHTPPRSLFFLYRFLSCPHLDESDGSAAAAQMLLDTIAHNKRIKAVTVFMSDLVFSSSTTIHPDFSLDSFHLEKVSVSDEFLKALSKLSSKSITKTLTLSSHTRSTWHPWFHTFLLWQLQELSLLGFDLEIPDLIDFLKHLQKCNDTSLHSLSLGDANNHAHEMSTALNSSEVQLVAAVIDALDGSGLPFFDLQGLPLRDPAIEAQLLVNQRKHSSVLKRYKKVHAMALRLFICGDAYAGKTTLLLSLAAARSKRTRAIRYVTAKGTRQALERTRGIEVCKIVKDNISMSMWDMAGQREFHAFHDLMFPDPSSNHSSPAIFMFVWSPVISKDEKDGEHKVEDAFENSFHYWLKFIASKTRQSNVTRKVIVVITRKDQMDLLRKALTPSIDVLMAKFSEIVEIVAVLEVDARSTSSVKPVANCIFETAKLVLHGAQTYDICSRVSRCLSSGLPQRNAFKDQPVIIGWDVFEKFCKEEFQIKDKHVQRAIASSLNESGDLIYLNNMLVLDPNWFCHEIMGNLIHFSESCTSRTIPIRGYANLEYLESVLQNHTQTKVKASHLVELMEAMNLCCKVPNDPEGKVFIAVSLSKTESISPLEWRAGNNKDAQEFAYLGRRLQCDRKDLTFLTLGLFPMLQVLFSKAFGEIEADVKLNRDVMSICIRGMEIIVEFGIAKGDQVIDVMVRVPDLADIGNTLMYVEEKIIQTIIRICAQPIGNQGVKLVEGIIRPDCLYEPAALEVREDQCVLIRDLKQMLRRQIEAGEQKEKLLYQWKESQHLKPVASSFVDLLGVKEFEEVLLSYKSSLEHADKEANQMIELGCIHNNEGTHKYLRTSHMSRCTNVHQAREDAASTSTQAGYDMQHNMTLEMGNTRSEQFKEESTSSKDFTSSHMSRGSQGTHEDLRTSHMSRRTYVCRAREDAASASTQAGYDMQQKMTLEMGKTRSEQFKEESVLPHRQSSKDRWSSHMSRRTYVCRAREDAASTSTQAGYDMQHKMTLQIGKTSSEQFKEESTFPHQSSEQINDDLKLEHTADENVQQIVLRFSKTMVSSINGELQKINKKLDVLGCSLEDIHEKLNAMQQDIYQMRNDILPKVLKIVEQSLYFAVGNEVGKVPRLVFLTTNKGGMRREMVTSIFKDLKSVRIELFCEHRGHPHKVEKQKGLCVTTINEGALKEALPWLNGILKLLTLVARVGAHVVAGLGNAMHGVPDLASIIALGFDTPGFLDNHSLPEASSSTQALAGWQQWLVSVLEKHGGMSESNIASKFMLRRAIYQDTSQVAWLCPEHYPPPLQLLP